MATVRLSKETRSSITRKIRDIGHCAESEVAPTKVALGDAVYKAIGQAIEDEAWGEYAHLKNQMPAKWCDTNNDVRVIVQAPADDSGGLSEITAVELKYELPPEGSMLFPPHWRHNHRRTILKRAKLSAECLAWWDSVVAGQRKGAEIKENYYKTAGEVDKILNSKTTLNAAVKDYPALRTFLSEELKDRLDQKVRRAPKAEASKAPEIDNNILTATAAAHSINRST